MKEYFFYVYKCTYKNVYKVKPLFGFFFLKDNHMFSGHLMTDFLPIWYFFTNTSYIITQPPRLCQE